MAVTISGDGIAFPIGSIQQSGGIGCTSSYNGALPATDTSKWNEVLRYPSTLYVPSVLNETVTFVTFIVFLGTVPYGPSGLFCYFRDWTGTERPAGSVYNYNNNPSGTPLENQNGERTVLETYSFTFALPARGGWGYTFNRVGEVNQRVMEWRR